MSPNSRFFFFCGGVVKHSFIHSFIFFLSLSPFFLSQKLIDKRKTSFITLVKTSLEVIVKTHDTQKPIILPAYRNITLLYVRYITGRHLHVQCNRLWHQKTSVLPLTTKITTEIDFRCHTVTDGITCDVALLWTC